MTHVYNPISLTWDECYLINEIIELNDFPEDDFEFDPADQSYFYGNSEEDESPYELLIE